MTALMIFLFLSTLIVVTSSSCFLRIPRLINRPCTMSTSALQGLEKLHIDQKTFDDLVTLVGPVVVQIRPQANPSQLLMMALRTMVHGDTIDTIDDVEEGLKTINIMFNEKLKSYHDNVSLKTIP